MTNQNVEERIAQLEADVSELKSHLPKRAKNPWATFGMMAKHEGYDEIVRLGAEYRQQERERELNESTDEAAS